MSGGERFGIRQVPWLNSEPRRHPTAARRVVMPGEELRVGGRNHHLIDPSDAIPAWADFAREEAPEGPAGSWTVDLGLADGWGPIMRRQAPTDS